MLEKYNNQIKKTFKLILMLIAIYFAIVNIPNVQLSSNDIAKLVTTIGIFYLILENYYPTYPIKF